MVDLPDEVKNMTIARPAPQPRPAADKEGAPAGRSASGSGGAGGAGGRSGAGRSGGGGGGRRPFQRRRRRFFGGGKVCQCCARKIKHLDYKDLDQLKFFVSSQGKILPRRMSGACARHQRLITRAIKHARNIALLPFRV